jgi:TolB protein
MVRGADEEIDIIKKTELGIPPTPITITGFTGEVLTVLKFDLSVMGFLPVPEGSANYVLSGSNEGDVRAMLSLVGDLSKFRNGDTLTATTAHTVKFNKQYHGDSLRLQAHVLADDVVFSITGVAGIAEKKGRIAQIAFKGEMSSGGEIFVSDFDGHNPNAATQDHSIVAAPCWDYGHFALYYTSYKLGSPEVLFQDLGTGERRAFASYPGMIGSPAVSPDGGKVALVLAKSGAPNIYVVDADGTGLRQLTFTKEDNSSPCWSPDGQWVCFASKVNERRALSKVSVNGGPMQTIPTSGFPSPTEPDWSPDGRWIAFTSQTGGFNICVVPAAGGPATELVAGEDPSWAPNSRTLVFVRRSRGKSTLSLLDVPTKQVKDVPQVTGTASNSQPSWAR